MHSKLSKLFCTLAVSALLFAGPPAAMAAVISFGPPGPAGYGEFYQSDQSPATDPSCNNCVDGGVLDFNGTDLEATYDDWVTSVFTRHGVLAGDFFGEDFDGPGWTHDQEFDSQEPPSGAPAIVDGITISNDLPDALAGPPDSLPLVPGRAEEPAKADESPGSSPAIDRLAWEARDEFDDNGGIPEATIDFSVNKTDFLGFYIFDASRQGTYNLQYTDGTIFSLIAADTDNQNNSDEGFYRFVGFVNTHPTAQINRFWVTNGGSRYGVDEIEWGRGDREVPEPGSLWLLSVGAAVIVARSRRRSMP